MGQVIRIGDTVKIITPERFIRCGYPFDQVKATDNLIDHYRDDIDAFIAKIDPNPKYPKTYIPEGDYRALCGRIARIVAIRDGFGGRERSLHTERDEALTGLRCTVSAKKVHKTGSYFAPSGGRHYGWDGDEDWYEPGGLSDEKTHVILTLDPCWNYDDHGRCSRALVNTPIMIERIHVEKEVQS